MEKKRLISPGYFSSLVIFVLIMVFAQISINNYVKKGKEADKQKINLVISGKLPDNLQCIKEIKIRNQELLILLDNTGSFRYDKKISENPIAFRNNCNPPVLIYSSCTYANNESHYTESLSLEDFDGRSAKFLTTVTFNGDAKPEINKKEFIVNDSSLLVTK